ncbi:MAG: Xaa-Pro peptidase family protein [Armatimonadota bacterium]|nr:Xaa-Pro peptidase family protein [Armatimonadota bacterium]MDR7484701.1 Xaa-Pro peptidase family protein [Armatimonadota bacterium]MDR7531816.1 Xaa-Pro peptidase family protein [Armatimonadota bacterium]MDR7534839.1 Xaa-Pro peptidase family protein [Armatimonadota bacterium]
MVDLHRLQAALAEAELDAVAAASPENTQYLSGAYILTQRLLPERIALVLWPRAGDPAFVICVIEERLTRQESRISDIRTYHEFRESPIDVLAAVIREKGLDRARIGIETKFLTAHYYAQMRDRLPGATLVPADGVFERLRMIKTDDEVARLGEIAMITDRAMRAAFAQAKPGDTERDVASVIREKHFEYGADEMRGPVLLGAGPNAQFIHGLPSSYRLAPGDICRVDVGGMKAGYFSDLARTVVVGKAAPEQRDTYRRLWDVHQTVLGAVRAGVEVRTLYGVYEQSAKRLGVHVERVHIGHSLGLGIHENPMITPHNPAVLDRNMVLCIEYSHFRGSELYHIEDTVVVQDGGCRILSQSADWSDLFVVQ